MKFRIGFSLLVILVTGLFSWIQPATAGAWVTEVQFNCTAKRTAGPSLTYASFGLPSDGTSFSIVCGTGKPPKHVQPGLSPTPELCQMVREAPNNKKPRTVPTGVTSNCNMNAAVNLVGNCHVSNGNINGSISSIDGKTISFSATWNTFVIRTIQLVGTTNKGGTLLGNVVYSEDINKDQSCIPFRDKEGNGSDGFKWVGTMTIVGVKETKC